MVRMLSGNDNIDASVGLSFSLELFKRYRRTGLLKAEIHHVPGIPDACKAYIQLIDGFVSSCIVINRRGQRIPSHQTVLCYVDDERGPFEWRFQASPSAFSSSDNTSRHTITVRPQKIAEQPDGGEKRKRQGVSRYPRIDNESIPVLHSYPQWNMLHAWTPAQKRMLYDVLTAIDGTRAVREIKTMLPLSDSFVEDALRVLLKMKVITLA